MKTVYNAVMARLRENVPALKWIDLDKGQLDGTERPAVAFPVALIGIAIDKTRALTDTEQECDATVEVTLGFESSDRTSANAPQSARENGLECYDVIADVYKYLQGYETENFDALNRTSQKKISEKGGIFKYKITFATTFTDVTAN